MRLRLTIALIVFAATAAAIAGGLWAGVFAAVAAVLPAWLLARWFVRPLHQLRDALVRGDRPHGGDWAEAREVAAAANDRQDALATRVADLDTERQHLLAVLGGMAEGVVAVGPGQRLLFANEAAGTMLDFLPDAAIGRPLCEIARQPSMLAVLERASRTAEPHREEVEFKKPTPRFLRVHVTPLAAADGAVIVLDDISDLRRLERVRQEFVANVSHELKTPLAVMKACVETLQDGAVEDPDARGPFLQQIADGGDRLHALILDLISLARIEAGETPMEFGPVPMDELVQASLDRHRPRAESKGMALESVPPTEPVAAWADAEAVGQILDNLVDNAVKYSNDGSVRVRWLATDQGVRLDVEDTGPGIPERDLPRVFERFYRVDKARSRELGGTGLGLAIVKHLAQAMKGGVTAKSTIGNGSTFTVTLPRAPG